MLEKPWGSPVSQISWMQKKTSEIFGIDSCHTYLQTNSTRKSSESLRTPANRRTRALANSPDGNATSISYRGTPAVRKTSTLAEKLAEKTTTVLSDVQLGKVFQCSNF